MQVHPLPVGGIDRNHFEPPVGPALRFEFGFRIQRHQVIVILSAQRSEDVRTDGCQVDLIGLPRHFEANRQVGQFLAVPHTDAPHSSNIGSLQRISLFTCRGGLVLRVSE